MQELIIVAVVVLIGVLPTIVVVRLVLFGLTNNPKHVNAIPFAPLIRRIFSPRVGGQGSQIASPKLNEPKSDHSLIPQTKSEHGYQVEVWFISREEKHFGPYSLDQLKRFVAEGSVSQETLIRHVHSLEWVQAGTVPELF